MKRIALLAAVIAGSLAFTGTASAHPPGYGPRSGFGTTIVGGPYGGVNAFYSTRIGNNGVISVGYSTAPYGYGYGLGYPGYVGYPYVSPIVRPAPIFVPTPVYRPVWTPWGWR